MPELLIGPEAIMTVAGAVVSLLFSYFPVLRTRFAALTPEAKSGVMIGLLLLIGASLFGLGCAGLVNTGVGCDRAGVTRTVVALGMALATNQGMWGITKNLLPGDVRKSGQPEEKKP